MAAGKAGDWVKLVNQPMPAKEIERIRMCIGRSWPYGSEEWQNREAEDLGWWDTLRRESRPSKQGGDNGRTTGTQLFIGFSSATPVN